MGLKDIIQWQLMSAAVFRSRPQVNGHLKTWTMSSVEDRRKQTLKVAVVRARKPRRG